MIEILDLIIFKPIMFFMEVFFNILKSFSLPNYILIFLFSIIINLILLPLYLRADKIQKEVNDKELLLKDDIEHINKYFNGDERLLILNTYYKQKGYNQFSKLKGSLSLILEIPLFICAYRFLSKAGYQYNELFPLLNINIYKSDSLISFNNITFNVLPIIMIIINFVSIHIYSENLSFKKKLPLYVLAILFFVLLYNSPSGLVLYWIFNNIFNLIKNVVVKRRSEISEVSNNNFEKSISIPWFHIIILLLLNIVLFSLFIPLKFINASINEFFFELSNINIFDLFKILFCFNLGVFGIWGIIIYFMLNNKFKILYYKILLFVSILFVFDYLIFTFHNDIFSADLYVLTFNNTKTFLLILNLIFAILIYILIFNKGLIKVFHDLIIVLLVVSLIYSFYCIYNINTYLSINNKSNNERLNTIANNKYFKLSKKGKNVIVLMLDSAHGRDLHYIFQENPELKEAYDGFRFYPNVISFGGFTKVALPAIFGGYEYTPISMNVRKNDNLKDKIDEACSVLPKIFKDNGYNVTNLDTNIAGDDIILKDNLNILNFPQFRKSGVTLENFSNRFIMFGFLSGMPRFIQKVLYDGGNYFCSSIAQRMFTIYEADGIPSYYLDEYNVLKSLSSFCEINNDNENNYLSIINRITHPPNAILQTPDYRVANNVDNRSYYEKNHDKFMLNGKYLFEEDIISKRDIYSSMAKYNVEVGALHCISQFIEFLKENDIYNNTRIIIVSDHGDMYPDFDEYSGIDKSFLFVPFLMVKDFGATGFHEDNTFMTNADVPVIALDRLVQNPINPYTGNAINNYEKLAHNQIIYAKSYKAPEGNLFEPSRWYSVSKNIYDINNWRFTKEEYVLDENELPFNDNHKFFKTIDNN